MEKLEGVLNPQEQEALAKAASVGFGQAAAPQYRTGVAAYSYESLDPVVKTVTFNKDQFVLWNRLNRKKSQSVIDEYVLKLGYGQGFKGSAFLEGGAPLESDTSYIRQIAKKAFYGDRKRITLQAEMQRTLVDVVAEERQNMVMLTMRNIERDAWAGNDMFVDAQGFMTGDDADVAEDLQLMSGLIQQVRKGDSDPRVKSLDFAGYGASKSVIFDAAGNNLSQEDIEDLSLAVFQNFGNPKLALTSPEVLSNYNKQFYPKERSQLVAAADRSGFAMKMFDSSVGPIELKASHFVRPKQAPASSALDIVRAAPQAPSFSHSAGAAPAGAPGLAAATYYYKIASINIHGEGLPCPAASQAALAGQAITLAISAPASGPTPAAYAVYRGESADDVKFVALVKANLSGNASFVDNGSITPAASRMLVMDTAPEVCEFNFMGNEMNTNELAQISLTRELICFAFMNVIAYQPRKFALLDNLA